MLAYSLDGSRQQPHTYSDSLGRLASQRLLRIVSHRLVRIKMSADLTKRSASYGEVQQCDDAAVW